MEKEFVSYEQAVSLKELGFDEDVFQRFTIPDMDDFCKHPLKQQALRWFREKYDLHCRIEIGLSTYCYYAYIDQLLTIDDCIQHNVGQVYNTYEEAENACIDKLIELAKQQDNV